MYTYTPSAELISMLTDNASKEWRIKFESSGHFGYDEANSSTANIWSAKAYEKENLVAYAENCVVFEDSVAGIIATNKANMISVGNRRESCIA